MISLPSKSFENSPTWLSRSPHDESAHAAAATTAIFQLKPKGTSCNAQRRAIIAFVPLFAARSGHVNAANRPLAQCLAPCAEKFGWTPTRAGVELSGAFHEASAVEQAAEVLLVQREPGDRFHN